MAATQPTVSVAEEIGDGYAGNGRPRRKLNHDGHSAEDVKPAKEEIGKELDLRRQRSVGQGSQSKKRARLLSSPTVTGLPENRLAAGGVDPASPLHAPLHAVVRPSAPDNGAHGSPDGSWGCNLCQSNHMVGHS
ncbi:hypothetical protein ED733_001570 [Metarhizium rileyi]|uniref:Uncharacterized protein n=1 Tax=Metarhizium rileyi (strain RCEF 4871) TaxID=1649241 RepID=A0A5C6G0N2_METRR|nr:hypothetical protein ED733_001570 [Metarhizium rileyi]